MNLIEKLGGMKTDFEFTSDGQPIKIESQYLVKRGKYDYHADGYSGYGYGVEALFLEFVFDDKLVTTKRITNDFRDNDDFEVEVFASTGSRILSFDRQDKRMTEEILDEKRMWCLDITNTPYVLLNEINRIDIKIIKSVYKKD